MTLRFTRRTLSAAAAASMLGVPAASLAERVELDPIGVYESGIFDESAAEIPAYDPATQRLFVVSADRGVDILDIADPTAPSLFGTVSAPNANSAAFNPVGGYLAVAVADDDTQAPGSVRFYDAAGVTLGSAPTGALPDMVTFTPDFQHLLVANEGEPNDDYTVDPVGSVSVINVAAGPAAASASTADFAAFDSVEAALKASGVRVFGPGASVSQDLEPEYIAVAADGTTAYVALQENNAVAVVDIDSATVTDVLPLGFKDFSQPGNGIDASDRDDAINITPRPVFGMYQPDAIAVYEVDGQTFLVTANEGDARDYDGFSEEVRVEDLTLDATAFPDAATLQAEENLGRLRVTDKLGDTDGDGDFDQLYAYGGRSFSIFRVTPGADSLELVFDSGDSLEQITAALLPDNFNSNNDENDSFDARSDDKGPEPEGITLATIGGKTYAFIGLERIGGIVVYDITDPGDPRFIQYVNPRDFSFTGELEDNPGGAGDLGPEGLFFIGADDSPIDLPLLVVANEVSGTTRIYAINTIPTPTAAMLGLGGLAVLSLRRRRV